MYGLVSQNFLLDVDYRIRICNYRNIRSSRVIPPDRFHFYILDVLIFEKLKLLEFPNLNLSPAVQSDLLKLPKTFGER